MKPQRQAMYWNGIAPNWFIDYVEPWVAVVVPVLIALCVFFAIEWVRK